MFVGAVTPKCGVGTQTTRTVGNDQGGLHHPYSSASVGGNETTVHVFLHHHRHIFHIVCVSHEVVAKARR